MLINKDADTNTKLANVLEVYNADAPWSVLPRPGLPNNGSFDPRFHFSVFDSLLSIVCFFG